MIAPSPERPATLAVRHLAREGRAVLATIGSAQDIASVDALSAEPTQIATEALRAAREEARGREHAERRRLAYVAMTRARGALVLIAPAQTPRSGSTFAALTAAIGDAGLSASITRTEEACALLEQAEAARSERAGAPPPSVDQPATSENAAPAPPARPATSPSRTLTVATTPLMVFGTCARRFQLRNLLTLDEPVSSGQLDLFGTDAFPGEADDERPSAEDADPRALGRAAHRVLEQWPSAAWGTPVDPSAVVARLADEGLPPAAGETLRIAEAVARFVSGPYAQRARERGARLLREEPFLLPVALPDAPAGAERVLALRGAMDLCVQYPDGSVDVIDYKRSRPRADLSPYGFQLRAYALAARRMRGGAALVRAGVVFLGGATEPAMLPGAGTGGALSDAEHEAFEAELAVLGQRLAEARWSDRWEGVPVESCKRLRCGFVTACHGRNRSS
jgi:ATP-dependent helicase/nuclease subunit A